MKTRISGVLGVLIIGGLMAMTLAPTAQAFHGAWYRGFGTARAGNVILGIDFVWGGIDTSIQCAGGGCQGEGDGWYHLTASGVNLPPVAFVGVEDVRNIFFFGPFTNHHGQTCQNVEVTPNYQLVSSSIGLVLSGRQEGCMDNFPFRENHSHFAGTLGALQVSIHANGPFTGGVPPAGAGDGWCCHG